MIESLGGGDERPKRNTVGVSNNVLKNPVSCSISPVRARQLVKDGHVKWIWDVDAGGVVSFKEAPKFIVRFSCKQQTRCPIPCASRISTPY